MCDKVYQGKQRRVGQRKRKKWKRSLCRTGRMEETKNIWKKLRNWKKEKGRK